MAPKSRSQSRRLFYSRLAGRLAAWSTQISGSMCVCVHALVKEIAPCHILSRLGTATVILPSNTRSVLTLLQCCFPLPRTCEIKYAVSYHFVLMNGFSVLVRSGSERFSRAHCSLIANLNGSAFSYSACAVSPAQPLYFRLITNYTNLASMYRICNLFATCSCRPFLRGRWRSPHPSCTKTVRREALHLLDRQAALFFEADLAAVHEHRKRGHFRSRHLALCDCLTESPNSIARSSSSAILARFFSGVSRCSAAAFTASSAAAIDLLIFLLGAIDSSRMLAVLVSAPQKYATLLITFAPDSHSITPVT